MVCCITSVTEVGKGRCQVGNHGHGAMGRWRWNVPGLYEVYEEREAGEVTLLSLGQLH